MHAEDAAGEFTLQYIFMLLVFFLVALTIFVVSYIQSVDFKNYVDSQAGKNGGFTATAMANIEDYSNKYFDGKFSVISLSGSDQQPYGNEIDYEIEGTVQIFFYQLPEQLIFSRGSTVSLVR